MKRATALQVKSSTKHDEHCLAFQVISPNGKQMKIDQEGTM
jgi:hypothetical protein